MEYQKTIVRIHHVPEEETKREGEGERMCQGPLSSRVKLQNKIKFTHCTIIYSHGFLCDKCNGLQLQTKECDWMRR